MRGKLRRVFQKLHIQDWEPTLSVHGQATFRQRALKFLLGRLQSSALIL